jgi:DNA-binding phage protein
MGEEYIMRLSLKEKYYYYWEATKMVKARTFTRRKTFSKNTQRKKQLRGIKPGMGVDVYDPAKALLDENLLGRAIWDCLKNDDPEGVIEVIKIHLDAYNKTQLASHAELPKTTLYHSFKNKNPTLKTLAKLVHACL